MAIEIEQDETRPEGGYVVLRLPGQAGAPDQLSVQLTPLDDPDEEAATWAKHPFQPAEIRRSGEDLDLVLGPEVVNGVPADLPLRVTIAALGIEEDCLWPSLRPLIAPRAGRLAQVPRGEVVGPAVPGKGIRAPLPPKEPAKVPEPGAGWIKPDAQTEDGARGNELGAGAIRVPDPLTTGSGASAEPPPEPEPPRRSPLGVIALGFLAGLALGAVATWALTRNGDDRMPGPAADPDLALLRAIDTGDMDEAGAPIFGTAAREWLRRGDQAQGAGDLAGAELDYRRALRSAWHENGAEPDAAIGRLAAMLAQGGGDPDKASQLRALMMLSVAAGDPAGMCRLAVLYEQGVGGPADLSLAAALRARATALLAGAPVPAGCD